MEDHRAEEPPDAEHGHEPESDRRDADATDVEVDVQPVEDPADDVVEHDRDEQQGDAQDHREEEHEVPEVDVDQDVLPP
jgi:hypothetical protein